MCPKYNPNSACAPISLSLCASVSFSPVLHFDHCVFYILMMLYFHFGGHNVYNIEPNRSSYSHIAYILKESKCVYVYVYIYICVYVCIHMHVHVHVHTCVCICVNGNKCCGCQICISATGLSKQIFFSP